MNFQQSSPAHQNNKAKDSTPTKDFATAASIGKIAEELLQPTQGTNNTEENEQGLRKIIDMTRLINIVVLSVHFYYCCFITNVPKSIAGINSKTIQLYINHFKE